MRDPQQLHQVGWRSRDGGGQSFRWREYEELRDRTDLFESAVAESTRFISSNGQPLAAALVSGNYFEALGPAVFMGRTWRADERGVEGVVLSYQGWRRLFVNDAIATIPRELDINGRLFPVMGILRPEFIGLSDSPRDVWIPFTTYAGLANPGLLGGDQPQAVEILARLKPGKTAAQAQAALTPFMARVVPSSDGVRAHVTQRATPNPLSVELAAVLAPVFAAFGLVLVAVEDPLLGLFTPDAAVVAQAHEIWWLFAALMPLNGAVFALDGILIGAGDTRFLMWGMLAAAAVYVPIALLALHRGWGCLLYTSDAADD